MFHRNLCCLPVGVVQMNCSTNGRQKWGKYKAVGLVCLCVAFGCLAETLCLMQLFKGFIYQVCLSCTCYLCGIVLVTGNMRVKQDRHRCCPCEACSPTGMGVLGKGVRK